MNFKDSFLGDDSPGEDGLELELDEWPHYVEELVQLLPWEMGKDLIEGP